MTSSRSAEVPEHLLLIDGTPLAVRVLGPADRDAFLRLHDDLPARDRWLRFLGGGAGYLRAAADTPSTTRARSSRSRSTSARRAPTGPDSTPRCGRTRSPSWHKGP